MLWYIYTVWYVNNTRANNLHVTLIKLGQYLNKYISAVSE